MVSLRTFIAVVAVLVVGSAGALVYVSGQEEAGEPGSAPAQSVPSSIAEPTTTSTSTSTSTSTTVQTRPPTTARIIILTNSVTIRTTCERLASEVLGRGRLTDAEAEEAVAAYHDLEREAQQPASTVVAAPALDTFCQRWLYERFPQEAELYGYGRIAGWLDDLLQNSPYSPQPSSLPPGGVCYKNNLGRPEYTAPRFGSCPLGWQHLR